MLKVLKLAAGSCGLSSGCCLDLPSREASLGRLDSKRGSPSQGMRADFVQTPTVPNYAELKQIYLVPPAQESDTHTLLFVFVRKVSLRHS